MLPLQSSRGCPWRCKFCINVVTKHKWQPLSADRFLDDLEYQVKKYRLEMVCILDEDFFVDKKRVRAIAQGMIKRNINITWKTSGRANYFRDDYLTIDFLKELYRSGLRIIEIGAESGSEKILTLLTKQITIDDIIRSAILCKEAGIKPVYNWMVGIPGECKDDIKASISLMHKIHRICPMATHSSVWIFRPYPGSDLYKLCKKHGFVEPDCLEDWGKAEGVNAKQVGYLDISNCCWVNDPLFITLVSGQYHIDSILLPIKCLHYKNFKEFLKAIFIKASYYSWDRPVIGYLVRLFWQWKRCQKTNE
jgi:hypothetical protein